MSPDSDSMVDRVRESAYRLADVLLDLPGGRTLRRLGITAATKILYREPWKSLRLIGVTGTNGKTTTTALIRHLLYDVSPCAALGTLGAMLQDGRILPFKVESHGTPGPVEMARMLRRLSELGVESVAMEVTAKSLEEGRVDQLIFETVVLTNLSRDHLDLFGTMDRYRSSKLKILSQITEGGTLVVNADDPAWNGAESMFGSGEAITYGIRNRDADVIASDIRTSGGRTRFELSTPRETVKASIPLIGRFNVYNALAASAVALARGRTERVIATRLSDAPQVPGRLERISDLPCPVYRDFAHNPGGLEAMLRAVRSHVEQGRIILVFGAGGERDSGARPLMGRAAVRHADEVIVTSDNPRGEDPESIIDDIVAGLEEDAYERETDRRAAIRTSLERARGEDVVIIAGKGHGTYQEVADETYDFDEAEIVGRIVDDLRNRRESGVTPRRGRRRSRDSGLGLQPDSSGARHTVREGQDRC